MSLCWRGLAGAWCACTLAGQLGSRRRAPLPCRQPSRGAAACHHPLRSHTLPGSSRPPGHRAHRRGPVPADPPRGRLQEGVHAAGGEGCDLFRGALRWTCWARWARCGAGSHARRLPRSVEGELHAPPATPPRPPPQVHHALSPQLGGSAFAPLEEVVARLARAGVCKGFPTAREGLLVNARFVLGQFERLDGGSGHKALKYLDTDFGKALAKEVRAAGGVPRACGPVLGPWGAPATRVPLPCPCRVRRPPSLYCPDCTMRYRRPRSTSTWAPRRPPAASSSATSRPSPLVRGGDATGRRLALCAARPRCWLPPSPSLLTPPAPLRAGKGKGVAGEGDAQMDADEEFARALQAKMDQEMRAK